MILDQTIQPTIFCNDDDIDKSDMILAGNCMIFAIVRNNHSQLNNSNSNSETFQYEVLNLETEKRLFRSIEIHSQESDSQTIGLSLTSFKHQIFCCQTIKHSATQLVTYALSRLNVETGSLRRLGMFNIEGDKAVRSLLFIYEKKKFIVWCDREISRFLGSSSK